MITFIIMVLSNILEFSIFYKFNTKVFISKKDNIYIWYFTAFICKTIFNLLNIPELNIIIALSIYLFLLQLVYKGSILKKLLTSLFFYSCALLSEVITFILSQMISLDNFLEFGSFGFYFFGILFSKLIQFIIVSILANILSIIDEILSIKDILSFIMMPIAVIMLILSVGVDVKNNIFAFLSIILLLISILLTSYFFSANIMKEKLESQLILHKQIAKNDQQYYNMIKEKSDLTREFRHNLKHYMNHLNFLLKAKKYKEASLYVNNLSSDLEYTMKYYSGFNMIDSILSSKSNILDEYKIQLVFEVENIDINWIEDIDKSVIFGNIIDNAIESCQKIENPKIKFQIRNINNMIVIRITNSCPMIDVDLKTLKEDKENHGLGLQSIRRIIQKYNGKCTFEFIDNQKIFITKIVIPKSN